MDPKIIQAFVILRYRLLTDPALTMTCLFTSNFLGPLSKIPFPHLGKQSLNQHKFDPGKCPLTYTHVPTNH